MKFHTSRKAAGLLAVSANILLVACGGGGGDTVTPPSTNLGTTAVPIAATQDSGAAFNFIAMVVAMGEANTENPLVLSDAANDPLLATSETADPMPVAA